MTRLPAADERALVCLLELVDVEIRTLEGELARALVQGRNATADRLYDRASELRAALEDAGAVLARFHMPTPTLPRRPGDPPR